jgi:hypothetical protein
MKKILILLVAFFCQLSLSAQDEKVNNHFNKPDNDIRTVFSQPRDHHQVGFCVGPEGVWTRFGNKNVYMAGLSLGAVVDHVFTVGLTGYAILNSTNLYYPEINGPDSTGSYLYGGYGGFKFEFKAFPKFPVHLNFPLIIGGGGLVYNTWNYQHAEQYNNNNYSTDGYSVDWDAFFVVEPGVRMEVNLVNFMRMDVGVSYRYTPDLDLMDTPDDLFNNFSLGFSLKFGKF